MNQNTLTSSGEYGDSAPGLHASGSGPQQLRWFLVFTKPAGEQVAKTNLERQRYGVYHPRLLRPALCRGRWVDRVISLFPRYLFVQLDVARQSLAPVRSTLGVANIVRFGQQVRMVPDSVVDGLIDRADPVTGLHRLSRSRPLEPGSRVKVIAGAFEGLDGIFECEGGSDRIIVLLSLLGHDTPVRIPSELVALSAL